MADEDQSGMQSYIAAAGHAAHALSQEGHSATLSSGANEVANILHGVDTGAITPDTAAKGLESIASQVSGGSSSSAEE